MSATAKETIRNQVMRFADPADMNVGNWDICTDNILKALDERGFAIVPKEPTEAMLRAYYACMIGTHPKAAMNPDKYLVHNLKARKRWFAMLAASTEPPKEPPND